MPAWSALAPRDVQITIAYYRLQMSDRGSEQCLAGFRFWISALVAEYCAFDYQALLRRHRIVPSHSRRGNCWDTVIESFFRSLRAEREY